MHWDDPLNRTGQDLSAYAPESAAHYTERITYYTALVALMRDKHAEANVIAHFQADVSRYKKYLENYVESTRDSLSKREKDDHYNITGHVVIAGEIVEIQSRDHRIHAVLPETLDRVPKIGEHVMVMFNKAGVGIVSSVREKQLTRAPSYEMGR